MIRPLRDLVLVRECVEEASSLASPNIVVPEGARHHGFLVYDVLEVGPEASVEKGQRVLSEVMSAPEGAGEIHDPDYGDGPLYLVHCRRLPSGGEMDQRARALTIEVEAYRKELKDRTEAKHLGQKDDERIRFLRSRVNDLERRLGELGQARRSCSRSRAHSPVRDPGMAEGILAVLQ